MEIKRSDDGSGKKTSKCFANPINDKDVWSATAPLMSTEPKLNFIVPGSEMSIQVASPRKLLNDQN